MICDHCGKEQPDVSRYVGFRSYRERLIKRIMRCELRVVKLDTFARELSVRLFAPMRPRDAVMEDGTACPPMEFDPQIFHKSPCAVWVLVGSGEALIGGHLEFRPGKNRERFDYTFMAEEAVTSVPSMGKKDRLMLAACYVRTPSRTVTFYHKRAPMGPDEIYVPPSLRPSDAVMRPRIPSPFG